MSSPRIRLVFSNSKNRSPRSHATSATPVISSSGSAEKLTLSAKIDLLRLSHPGVVAAVEALVDSYLRRP